MLKVALLLGGALLVALATRSRAFLDFLAWLLAVVVALVSLALGSLPVLLPLAPKLFATGLLMAILRLFDGGQP